MYKKTVRLEVCIRTTSNNIFCTLLNKRKNTVLLARSAGNYKYNVSKKSLKYYRKIILKAFLKEIKICRKEICLLISIQSSKGLRNRIVKQVCLFFSRCKIYLNIKSLKPFNGCRASKQKRKKRKGLVILK
jgi:ribosomal protein S11